MDEIIELPKRLSKNYSYYDNIGRIIVNYYGTVVEEMDTFYPDYQRIDGIYSGNTYYVLDGIPTIRLPQETIFSKTTLNADGIDTINITFPHTGTLTIRGADNLTVPITGDETFTTTIAGIYYININAFPYLDFNVTVEAI